MQHSFFYVLHATAHRHLANMPSSNKPLTNKLVVTLMFTKKSREEYMCSTCSKTCRSAHGYTNLITHLRTNHPSYLEDAAQAAKDRNALRLRVIDEETRNIFRWCEWTVMDRLPLSFVERKMTRKNAVLSPISEKTLKTYLVRVFESAEVRAAEELPATFGIVLDGSTFSGRHYIAIFAVFNDPDMCSGTSAQDHSDYFEDTDCYTRRFVLLAFCPLDVEEDLGAQSLFDLIADTLSRYNKPWESVPFMVADNCNVNQYIGNREGAVPMVGCASHRFNLAIFDYLISYEALLAKINALMTKLRTIKGRAVLRRVTDLSPVLRNDTRWSSSYAMLHRYPKLEPALNSLGHGTLEEFDIQPLLLRRAESERAHALLKVLTDFEGVTKTLQRSTLTLSGARRLFDLVCQRYPQLKTRLSATTAIVNNVALEMGIVKIQRKESLAAAERHACADFRRVDREAVEATPSSELSLVQQAFKKRRTAKRSMYDNVAYIPPTSNECERFFSAVKLVYSDLRKRLDPSTLEMIMLIMYNRDMWDVYTVESVRT